MVKTLWKKDNPQLSFLLRNLLRDWTVVGVRLNVQPLRYSPSPKDGKFWDNSTTKSRSTLNSVNFLTATLQVLGITVLSLQLNPLLFQVLLELLPCSSTTSTLIPMNAAGSLKYHTNTWLNNSNSLVMRAHPLLPIRWNSISITQWRN